MRITVRVKPGSRQPGISETGGTLTVAVRERAVEGRANAAVLATMAGWLGIAAGRITIEHGAGSRIKRLSIDGFDERSLATAIRSLRVDG